VPKLKKNLLIFIALVLILVLVPILLKKIPLFLEKQALKPPPPAKTLLELKGISEVKLSSQSGKIKYPHDQIMVLLGDSMTEELGNSDELRGFLNQYYPNTAFEVLNYGFGSTNILSTPKRLSEQTFYQRDFRAILDIDFDIILIESFGHNPLSEFPLETGLKKQTETLDLIIWKIKEVNPKAKIVFVATIGPSKENYAKGSRDLSSEERKKWAEERIAYIKNHMKYAELHNIPLVNIFEKSVDKNESGKSIYIDSEDNIHPSPTGVLLISKEIADFLFQNKIIPE